MWGRATGAAFNGYDTPHSLDARSHSRTAAPTYRGFAPDLREAEAYNKAAEGEAFQPIYTGAEIDAALEARRAISGAMGGGDTVLLLRRQGRGYWPITADFVESALIISGRFVLASGIVCLVVAAFI